MASPDDAIDVDVPPSPIKRGTGDANEPLELVSSDSEDEKPRTPRPAKRTKLASATPPSPPGNAQLAQLRREREARRGPPPPPQPDVIQDAEGVRGLVVVKNFCACFARLAGGTSSSESDDASSSGWLASPVPRLMRGDGGTSTIIASSGEAIYDFFKHSASDDAGVSVSK